MVLFLGHKHNLKGGITLAFNQLLLLFRYLRWRGNMAASTNQHLLVCILNEFIHEVYENTFWKM